MTFKKTILFFFTLFVFNNVYSQQYSNARKWMDTLLEMVKVDGLGPTIEARNIFHTSIGMYDAWAIYDKKAEPYLVGKKIGDFQTTFDPSFLTKIENIDSVRQIAINYAAYHIIFYRYNEYSSKGRTMDHLDKLAAELAIDPHNTDMDYTTGKPEALGNYIAQCVIDFGSQDGSKEVDLYESHRYEPVNPALRPDLPGTNIKDPNRWQPISISEYIDKKGWDVTLQDWNNLVVSEIEVFLSPEWGEVTPFALSENDKKTMFRGNIPCDVYLDPGPPPYLNKDNEVSSEQYQWGFALNAVWSAFHDPADSVKIDISPAVIGNVRDLPENFDEYADHYNFLEGGFMSEGHAINPYTDEPYEPNVVYRGDYTRVISEFWIDGINTYTPPGHWIKNLNYVSYHPDFERKWMGKGKELSQLEWDIKAYLTLTGALHDAAIAAFSVKGLYDFVRPISAIRYMAGLGQSTDPMLPNYHRLGLPLIDGHIELVGKKDPLVGKGKEHLNKIKIYSWRGPDAIEDVLTEQGGVGWILAENWWPYQRYTFLTPNFAGYVSGHSTFSAAGAQVLESITGSPFFPMGIYEFTAKKNKFLEFEEGPSTDVTLQWATYWDAAYETCLSRLYGGIHPPCDDIPGRKMGIKAGENAVHLANGYFKGKVKK